jgi:hypothetical protein
VQHPYKNLSRLMHGLSRLRRDYRTCSQQSKPCRSNQNGSYYYQNPNGSTYYKSASGSYKYTAPQDAAKKK